MVMRKFDGQEHYSVPEAAMHLGISVFDLQEYISGFRTLPEGIKLEIHKTPNEFTYVSNESIQRLKDYWRRLAKTVSKT